MSATSTIPKIRPYSKLFHEWKFDGVVRSYPFTLLQKKFILVTVSSKLISRNVVRERFVSVFLPGFLSCYQHSFYQVYDFDSTSEMPGVILTRRTFKDVNRSVQAQKATVTIVKQWENKYKTTSRHTILLFS